MTLHIFNPEHDLALAAGLANFTAPHAGRQLRHDLGFLPALWAEENDVVLVDDPKQAEKALKKLQFSTTNSHFISPSGLARLASITNIEPWGWDSALHAMLVRKGVNHALMPTDAQMADIRQLSHRREGAWLLNKLRCAVEGTKWCELLTGESFECTTLDEVQHLLCKYGSLILKSPWSSSGRGLQFVNASIPVNSQRFIHIVEAQGSLMVEPYYHKVRDLGMEFWSDGQGNVSYEGLSLFHTENGAYTGNILATEEAKRKVISKYLPLELLDWVQMQIATEMGARLKGRYRGPFGVDMMVVAHHSMVDGQCSPINVLHPCVEINLRRTMGHVALTLSQLVNPKADDELCRVMRIDYENTRTTSDNSINKIYRLKIKHL